MASGCCIGQHVLNLPFLFPSSLGKHNLGPCSFFFFLNLLSFPLFTEVFVHRLTFYPRIQSPFRCFYHPQGQLGCLMLLDPLSLKDSHSHFTLATLCQLSSTWLSFKSILKKLLNMNIPILISTSCIELPSFHSDGASASTV